MEKITLSKALLQKIVNFLGSSPYAAVAQLIGEIQSELNVKSEVKEEKKE